MAKHDDLIAGMQQQLSVMQQQDRKSTRLNSSHTSVNK
jgi:hypothetical protein